MLVGVLLFGGVTFVARSSGSESSTISADRAAALLWTARVMWGVAVVGCVLLYWATRRATTTARVASLSIGAWALGEMVAIFGGAVWFLTGSPAWYLLGVTFLVLTFLAFPGKSRKRADFSSGSSSM